MNKVSPKLSWLTTGNVCFSFMSQSYEIWRAGGPLNGCPQGVSQGPRLLPSATHDPGPWLPGMVQRRAAEMSLALNDLMPFGFLATQSCDRLGMWAGRRSQDGRFGGGFCHFLLWAF